MCPYWTVIVPWIGPEYRTVWHPTDPTFAPLTRGAFKTEAEAIEWGKAHLRGTPYSLLLINDSED